MSKGITSTILNMFAPQTGKHADNIPSTDDIITQQMEQSLSRWNNHSADGTITQQMEQSPHFIHADHWTNPCTWYPQHKHHVNIYQTTLFVCMHGYFPGRRVVPNCVWEAGGGGGICFTLLISLALGPPPIALCVTPTQTFLQQQIHTILILDITSQHASDGTVCLVCMETSLKGETISQLRMCGNMLHTDYISLA